MNLPYLIAEIGVNHGGDVAVAETMIRRAAHSGVNAVKFQYYRAKDLAAADSPIYFNADGVKTQREFFARYDALRYEDYVHLARVARDCKVDFGCTVFQPEDVELIDPLVTWHKIASADIDNWPLWDAILACRKPVFYSTGAATGKDIARARRIMAGSGELHCVLEYPTKPEHANLLAIRECNGYSCHVPFSLDILVTAWLLGAEVIEKHFTLDKSQPGNDHYHSMDPNDVRRFIARCKELQPILGDGYRKQLRAHEQTAYREARRSLYAKRDMGLGHVVTQDDLRYLRPAHGLRPGQEGLLLGKRLKHFVAAETLLAPEMVE